MFSFKSSNGWHKPGMHLDTTCLFAKNAHDCWAPNTTGANSGKSCRWQDYVLPILSEPQGSLLLCSPFAPFPATHPLLDLAKTCSHPFSSSWDNHLCPKICLEIRPWQGPWLLLFPATSLHKWLSPFTHKKETSDTRWLCVELLFAADQWPGWRQPLTHIKETPLLEYVQSVFLSHPSPS